MSSGTACSVLHSCARKTAVKLSSSYLEHIETCPDCGRACAIVAATPVVAHAQIYSWRDATGNLVLSDTPKDGGQRAFAVNSGDRVLTTRAGRQPAGDRIRRR